MGLTVKQLSKVQRHPNFCWLRERADRGELLPAATVETKLRIAIDETFPKDGRATQEVIAQLAKSAGVDWGQFWKPETVATGTVAVSGATEIRGTDRLMAQAVRMAIGANVGRSAPGTSGINHIHVGGNAHKNLLFVAETGKLLGVVDFHMDGDMTGGQRNQVEKVGKRISEATSPVTVRGDTVS